MKQFSLAQQMKVVEGLAPAADAAGRSSDIVSLKNYQKAFIVCHITQGNAATVALTIRQSSDVAGTGDKALAKNIPIWTNLDTAAADALTRQSDGVAYTTDAAVKNKIVIFEVDAAALDVDGGFDCIKITTGASNAANITQMMFVLAGARFQQAALPSAIVD